MDIPQDRKFESDLEEVYETWIKVMIMEIDVDHLNEIAVRDITGFGTTIDENINGIEACRELIEKQISESENALFHFDRIQLRKRMLADGQAALMVEEGEIKLELVEGTVQFPFRTSSLLEKIDDQWKVVHWHASTPVMSEDDTWHINDWKTKNQQLEAKVAEKTRDLELSLAELKATQSQLIQSEKLASLGQLAAGIAHEIKNPMNFINNFSELSLEYLDEIKEALAGLKQNETTEEISELLEDVAGNLKKVHHHGTRADNIVKSMLMHSRGGTGKMEPTNLNELLKEYVNLAFHGMRAGKNAINVTIDLNLDETIGDVSLNTEDFSRVILNLCKNAFDAMRTKSLQKDNPQYQPVLTVRTNRDEKNTVHLEIEDNGPGVPEAIREKLFQPFFTTKKGTEGTGLGLSISHDIVSKHQGTIKIISKENAFTRFHILLPQNHE